MTTPVFTPTLRQQISVSFAYLAYSGELLTGDPASVSLQIYGIMKETMPQIPPLLNGSELDWEIVWGPAIYTFPDAKLQDNLMYVVRQISDPTNYVVGVRGTNAMAIWDWVEEDLEVWQKVPWSVPPGVPVQGSPAISKATQNGINVLLNNLIPVAGVPGFGQNITAFLSSVAASGKINILFTGHSLGGALSPTLALWFRQSQNLAGDWDPNGNATVSTVPFAGPTAGNQDFATFFNEQLGSACDRIYNTLDIVPQAWETDTLSQLPNLYLPTIRMTLAEKLLVDFLEKSVTGYIQPNTGDPVTWTIQPDQTTYVAQAGIQHTHSYPTLMQVPALLTVINNGKS
jgi:hypothetical protein